MCSPHYVHYNFIQVFFDVLVPILLFGQVITIPINPKQVNPTSSIRPFMSQPKSMEHEFRCMTTLLNLYNSINIINPNID